MLDRVGSNIPLIMTRMRRTTPEPRCSRCQLLYRSAIPGMDGSAAIRVPNREHEFGYNRVENASSQTHIAFEASHGSSISERRRSREFALIPALAGEEKRSMWQQILAMVAANLLLMFRGSKSTGKLDAVADFDLGRFLGCWYVAAYIPHPFKKKLSSVSTEYSRSEDGTISVIHRGYDRKKTKWHSEESVARFKESEDSGWLVVDTHNPLDENHKIIHLKEDYTQAIVVGLTMRTLWITYHDPNVTKRDLDGLIARADALGFKTSKLIRVDQSIDWESPDFQGPSNDDSSGP